VFTKFKYYQKFTLNIKKDMLSLPQFKAPTPSAVSGCLGKS
jgi:hypothetical protein